MENSKQQILLRKRNFYERDEMLNIENQQVNWEQRHFVLNKEYIQKLENQIFSLDKEVQKQFLSEAEIINSQSINQFICQKCKTIAFDPVECRNCSQHMCNDCYCDQFSLNDKSKHYKCCGFQIMNYPFQISEKSRKKRNGIEVSCNNENCEKFQKVMSLEDYMDLKNHVVPCLRRVFLCPLDCKTQLKSFKEGQDHFLRCINLLVKCKICDQLILNKMQGYHDCQSDLIEKIDQIQKFTDIQIQSLQKQIKITDKKKILKDRINNELRLGI